MFKMNSLSETRVVGPKFPVRFTICHCPIRSGVIMARNEIRNEPRFAEGQQTGSTRTKDPRSAGTRCIGI